MPFRSPRLCLLALVAALGMVAPAVFSSSPALAARATTVALPLTETGLPARRATATARATREAVATARASLIATRVATMTTTPISTAIPVVTPTASPSATSTVSVNQQVILSNSGLTTMWMPRQVVSGGQLIVLVHTTPLARVLLTIEYPDGTTQVERRRAAEGGYTRFSVTIAYQPQGSAEAATITVESILRSSGLDDSVPGSVSVLQHIVLKGAIKAPQSAMVGRWLTVTVAANQPGATVRLRIVYPDKQEVSHDGFADADGNLSYRFLVSSSDGTRGYLRVEATLSYNGVQKSLSSRRVALRAAKS